MFTDKQNKGITPVIAIVLLLALTVAAVGIVWTQFQGFVGQADEDAGFLESVDVNLLSATRVDSTSDDLDIDANGDGTVDENMTDTIEIRFENTMEEQFILNESLRMEYSIPGESRVQPQFVDGKATQIFGEYWVADLSNVSAYDMCLRDVSTTSSGDDRFFSPGETISCNTGVEMPQPTDPITIYLVEVGSGEVADEYTCNPSSTDSTTC
jgi:flagellin-like protein